MFRRKKKEEPTDAPPAIETSEAPATEEAAAPVAEGGVAESVAAEPASETPEAAQAESVTTERATTGGRRGNRVQKVGTVSSDKMQKTVIVRVDRLVLHRKYRRYVRRTSKFMAHDELGATTGDRVRIVETRPLSTRKRWRVVEIVQKAAK